MTDSIKGCAINIVQQHLEGNIEAAKNMLNEQKSLNNCNTCSSVQQEGCESFARGKEN